MLTKLIKYDSKKLYRFLIIFYLLAAFSAGLSRILLSAKSSFILNALGLLCQSFYIAMIINIIINNIMRLWVRFQKTMYADESYLTHTLPVTRSKLHLAKMIVSIGSFIISTIAIALTLLIAFYSKENMEALKNILSSVASTYDSSIMGIIILFLVVCAIELISSLTSGYTGIILGHKMQNNKIPFSVAYGFLVYMSTQIFALLITFIISLLNSDMKNLFLTNEIVNLSFLKYIAIIAIVIYTCIIIILYFINNYLLNKGVNVE